jgi:ferredoxin
MTFRVSADLDRCQGHGKCMIACPAVFDSDEQGYVVVRIQDVPDSLRAAVQRCVEDCPEGALHADTSAVDSRR